RRDVVLVDERHAPVGMPDSPQPPATLANPGVQLPDVPVPAIDRHLRIDPPDGRLVAWPVNGVLQLQVGGQADRLGLGPAPAAVPVDRVVPYQPLAVPVAGAHM